MNIKEFEFDEETSIEGGSIPHSGVLIIRVTGPQRFKINYEVMYTLLFGLVKLSKTSIATLIHYENPLQWRMTLSQAAHLTHYKDLHGKSFEAKELGLTITLEHLELEKSRGRLEWVPHNLKAEYIQKVIANLTGDAEAEVKQMQGENRWSFTYKKTEEEVPHYTHINIRRGEQRQKFKVLISLPGRRTRCYTCGEDTHWSSQCHARKTAYNERQQEAPERPPPPSAPRAERNSEQRSENVEPAPQFLQPAKNRPNQREDGYTRKEGRRRKRARTRLSSSSTSSSNKDKQLVNDDSLTDSDEDLLQKPNLDQRELTLDQQEPTLDQQESAPDQRDSNPDHQEHTTEQQETDLDQPESALDKEKSTLDRPEHARARGNHDNDATEHATWAQQTANRNTV
jgi:hypothetical protein